MTPQVLSIIPTRFEGDARARAIGAYSMILAVGVAAGQVLGGALVQVHLLAAAWRPALLLNAPIGAVLLVIGRHALPSDAALTGQRRRRLDLRGAAILAIALLGLITALTFGRNAGWPAWVWPALALSAVAFSGFVALERRIAGDNGDPVFDLELMNLPGVAPGIVAVTLVMACYAGLLLSLTLYLQVGLGFGPLHAGATFAIYACGFATASLTWTRIRARDRLPIGGPLLMGAAILGIALMTRTAGWPPAATALLFLAGAGHACGFSPLTSRMTTVVEPTQAADLSGLVMSASLIGQVLGIAGFVGVYLGAASHGPQHALALTADCIAAALVLTAGCAWAAVHHPGAGRADGALATPPEPAEAP
jgi:MFS family permease